MNLDEIALSLRSTCAIQAEASIYEKDDRGRLVKRTITVVYGKEEDYHYTTSTKVIA